MKRSFCIALILCSSCFELYAQNKVTGCVNNAEKEAIPYVSVRLLRADSTFVKGAVTDSLGIFSLSDVQAGHYLLSFSSIGYKGRFYPVVMENESLSLPPVTLETDSVVQLDGVTVTASSFIRKPDYVLIIPDKQQVKHSYTGYDLLYRLMIPGVDVDRMGGKVTSMGNDASLYIDGQPVSYREVQSLRPRDIEKVEYHDMPSGKYAGDFVAINFITKKYTTGGYVSLDAKQTIGYLNGDYNGVVKLNRGNTDYTLFVGHQMNRYDGETEDLNETFRLEEGDVVRHTATLENRVKNNSQYAQLRVKNSSKKRSLSGKFSLVRKDMPDNYTHNLLEYSNNSAERKESYKYTDQTGLMPSLELYGHFNLKEKQFLEARLTANYNRNKYDYRYQEGAFNSLSHADEDMYNFEGQIAYGITFNKRHSLTAKGYHYHAISSTQYEGSKSSWQHLWSGETMLFAEYKYKLDKNLSIKLSPGVSLLQYRLHGAEREHAVSPRFQAHIQYSPRSNHQLALDGSVGSGHPNLTILNSAEQVIDSLQIRRGNPKEEVGKVYAARLSYSTQLKNVNVALYASYNGYFNVYLPFYYQENDKIVQTTRNDGRLHAEIVGLSLGWKVTDNFRLKADGSWIYFHISGHPKQLNAWNGRLQADFYWRDFAFSAYGQAQTDVMSGDDLVYTTTPASYGLFATWNHGSWHIEAGTENPFTKRRDFKYSLITDVYEYQRMATCRINQQTGYIKVAYTFDFGRKTSRDKRDVNTNINSAILKAD